VAERAPFWLAIVGNSLTQFEVPQLAAAQVKTSVLTSNMAFNLMGGAYLHAPSRNLRHARSRVGPSNHRHAAQNIET
jgi:hypothetical protein